MFDTEVGERVAHRVLHRRCRADGAGFADALRAERVAWRVIKDWLEAQLALIDAQMATLDQVMLPYLVIDATGKTLYGSYRDREQVALEAGGGSDV